MVDIANVFRVYPFCIRHTRRRVSLLLAGLFSNGLVAVSWGEGVKQEAGRPRHGKGWLCELFKGADFKE